MAVSGCVGRLLLAGGSGSGALRLCCPPLMLASPSFHRSFRGGSGVVAMGHGSHDSDQDPTTIEREKQRNLTGQTPEIVPGQPGFNPALASDSEAAVRADRAPSLTIEELQEHTIKIVQHIHDEAPTVAVPAQHVPDPSAGSSAIRDNLANSSSHGKRTDVHKPT